ncbi:hypothetical protein A2U01_0090298, partial [Trifolium medium]|nr:hypothetical protein [Trifolium medium]
FRFEVGFETAPELMKIALLFYSDGFQRIS